MTNKSHRSQIFIAVAILVTEKGSMLHDAVSAMSLDAAKDAIEQSIVESFPGAFEPSWQDNRENDTSFGVMYVLRPELDVTYQFRIHIFQREL